MTKTRQWTVFTAVAVLVVFAAGWFVLVKPQRSHAADLRGQAVTQQQANQILLSKIAALQAEEKTLPQKEAALQKFATQVPDNAAEPTLLRQLSAASNASNVDLVTIQPGSASLVTATAGTVPGSTSLSGTPSDAGQLVELPVALTITGNYSDVESFFMTLEKLPRALLVGSWTLCGSSGGSGASGSSGTSCAAVTSPTGATLPTDTLSGTLNADVFYSPPAGTNVSASTGSTTSTAPTATTSATPAPTTSTASTPAPTTSSTPAS
jgi:Tfp pilus assembly protein PilO